MFQIQGGTYNEFFRANTQGIYLNPDGDGKVGIGTETPDYKLDVRGDSAIYGMLTTHDPDNMDYKIIFEMVNSNYGRIQTYGTATVYNQNLALQPHGGNVGIGTTSPDCALDVESSGSEAKILIQNDTLALLQLRQPTENYVWNLEIGRTDGEFSIRNGSGEKVRIKANGYVGIGTTTPTAALSVVGGRIDGSHPVGCHLGQATSRAFLELCHGTGAQIDFATGDGSNDYGGRIDYIHSDDKMSFGTNGTSGRMTIDSAGNVGIGIDSPGSDNKLEVELGQNKRVHFHTSVTNGGGAGLMIGDTYNHASTPMYYIVNESSICKTGTRNNTDLSILTNWSSRIYIKKDGNVGIGTDSPTSKLHVISTNIFDGIKVEYSDTNPAGVYIGYGGISSIGNTRLRLGAGNTEYMTISNGGNVGIGTTSPAAQLEVSNGSSTSTEDTFLVIRNLNSNDQNAGIKLREGSTDKYGFTILYDDANSYGNANNLEIIRNDNSTTGVSCLSIERDTGHVGIGTVSPGSTLHIKALSDSNYITSGYKSHSSYALTMERYGTTDTWSLLINSQGSTSYNDLNFLYNGNRKGYLLDTSVVNQIDFTGQHRNIVNNAEENSVGLIVVSTGKYINLDNNMKPNINESLPICEISNKEKDKSVFGVISDKEDEERVYHTGAWASVYEKANVNEKRYFINSVGEGAMWVCNTNGDLENGDYITTSNVSGYGQKQDDDLLHNFTVAKITCDCNFSLMKQNQKQIKTIQKERIVDDILKDESGNIILDASGNETIIQKTITEQELVFDNSGNVIIEDKQDLSGNSIEDYPYDIRFLLPDGSIISEEEYLTLKSNNETCYIAYFVGVTYHCG